MTFYLKHIGTYLSIAIACILLSKSNVVLAQQKSAEKLPIDSHIKVGTLANGLTYYIRKNNRPENKVELRLAVNAGSVLEDDDQQGLAHFTEHMAFNGTKNFEKNELVSFLQSIGVKFGADLNAYTSFNETVYILPIPTEKKENVEKGFQILEDWASTISFDDAEIDKERGVVLEESRIGKGAEDRMFRVVYPKIFEGSKYAERLPIGKDEILKNFKYETLKNFYSDWYRPDLMAVAVVGNIEVAEAEQYIKDHFGKLKNPSIVRPRTLVEVQGRTESEGIVVTDKEATNHVIDIYHSYKREKEQITVEDYREDIVRRLFTTMLSQRLQELTQKAEPPFIYGGSFLGSYARGYEGFQSRAYISKAGAEPAIQALVQENERARKYGFTAAELERTKKMIMKSVERSYSERDKTESSTLVNEYLRHFLRKEPIPGIENEYKYHQQFLDKITLEEVNKYAAAYIPSVNEHKLVVFTGPDQADFKIPTNAELLTMAQNAGKADIKPYEEKQVATALLTTKPKGGKTTSEKVNSTLGTVELTLSNGIKVILKSTDFKNDQVLMNATRFGGQYLFDAKDRYNAEFASTVVSQMGVADFSPLDLRKVLAGKNATVAPRLSSTGESLSGQCSADDLEIMLQLTHLYLTSPRKDDDLFKSFISKQQASYQNQLADPQIVFQDSVLKILYSNHPWAPRIPTPETFTKIDQQKAFDIYKERFGYADGFTFILVGAFKTEQIKPLLETYLGGLPTRGKSSSFKDVGLRPVKGIVKKDIKKGTEEKSFIRLYWNGEAPYSEDEQLKIQALAEVMSIKIIETLREDLGSIYGGSMFGNMSKIPYGSYSLGVGFPCGPENVDKIITETLSLVDKVKANGPSEVDLNKIKETWRQQHQINLKENAYWLRQLTQRVEYGTDAKNILNHDKRIAALSVKDLQETAKKYLDMNNYVQIVLYPEVKN